MNKFKIKPILRTKGEYTKGKSSTNLDSKAGSYDVVEDLKSVAANNPFEKKSNEYSRMFFLNAMNEYERKLSQQMD